MDFPDFVGVAGTAIVLVFYFLVQAGKIHPNSKFYQLANMIACLLIIYSLIYKFNFPSFLMQVLWFGISFYGFIKNGGWSRK